MAKRKPIIPPQYITTRRDWIDAYEAPLCAANLKGKVVALAGLGMEHDSDEDAENYLLRKPVRRKIDASHDSPRVFFSWEVPSRKWKPLNDFALRTLIELGESDKARFKDAKAEAIRRKSSPPSWGPPEELASESKTAAPSAPPKPGVPGPTTDRAADQKV